MARFTDNEKREWELSIDAQSITRIREAKDSDPNFLLNDFDDPKHNTFARLQGDPVLLCRVIYLLCEKQRVERGISEESFYMGVIGNAIDDATEAMLQAIVNFTPRRTRDLLKVFADQDRMRQAATDRIVSKIQDTNLQAEVMKKLEDEIDHKVATLLTLFSSATDSPELSESLQSA